MERRNFIKYSAGLTAFFSASKAFSTFSKNSVFSNKYSIVSLEVVSDKVDDIIEYFNSDLKHYFSGIINYTETHLNGIHCSDLTVSDSHGLINYKKNSGIHELTRLAKIINTNTKLKDPSLLTFYSEVNIDPKYFNIFHKNKLIERIDYNSPTERFKIRLDNGEIYLSVENNSIKVEESSCKHKTCKEMGSISKAGQNIVCIPNDFRISIDGSNV